MAMQWVRFTYIMSFHLFHKPVFALTGFCLIQIHLSHFYIILDSQKEYSKYLGMARKKIKWVIRGKKLTFNRYTIQEIFQYFHKLHLTSCCPMPTILYIVS